MGKDVFLDMTMCTWNVLDKMTTSSSRDCWGRGGRGCAYAWGRRGSRARGTRPKPSAPLWEVTGRPPDKQADKRRQEAALETCRQEVRADRARRGGGIRESGSSRCWRRSLSLISKEV